VIRKETSERWLTVLLGRSFRPGRETGDAVFALSQLARVANDRARDIDETLRVKVLDRLSVLGADETALRPVREYQEWESTEQGQALGDTLPIGLRLVSDANPGSAADG
jgi:DNA-K related protein